MATKKIRIGTIVDLKPGTRFDNFEYAPCLVTQVIPPSFAERLQYRFIIEQKHSKLGWVATTVIRRQVRVIRSLSIEEMLTHDKNEIRARGIQLAKCKGIIT